MPGYNESRLEFIPESRFTDERKAVEQMSLGRVTERKRNNYLHISRETPPELHDFQRECVDLFSNEYELATGHKMDQPAILFVPWKNREELRKLNTSFANGRGVYDSDAHAVIILMDKTFTRRHFAMILAHELAHAYSKKSIILHAHARDPKNFWSKAGATISKKQRGMVCSTRSITIGHTLEEYYAAKREIEIAESDEFVKYFKQDEDVTMSEMQAILDRGEWVPEKSSLVRSLQITKESTSLALSGYFDLVSALDQLFTEVPQGFDLLKNARYTGDYEILQRAIDHAWGVGMFKYLMHGGTNYEFAQRTRALLNSERSLREAILVTLTSFRNKKRKMGGNVEV